MGRREAASEPSDGPVRSSRRQVAIASAAVVAVVIGALVVRAVTDDGADPDVSASAYCRALREPVWGRTDDGAAVDAIVFVVADVSDSTSAALEDAIRSHRMVSSVTTVSQAQAYEEFQSQFAAEPAMLDAATPEVLPSSIRVALEADAAQSPDAWVATVEDMPGVFRVITAENTYPYGTRTGDALLRPFVDASPNDIAMLTVPAARVEILVESAPDELVSDLEVFARSARPGSIAGAQMVEITPDVTEAAGRLLDHAESHCGLTSP